MPAQYGVRRGDCRDLLECFPTQLLPNLSQGVTVAIDERHATRELLAKEAVLCGEVRIAEPELFVNRCAKRSQQFLPVHPSVTPNKTAYMDNQYGRTHDEIQSEACIMVEA